MAKTTPTSIRLEEDQFLFVCEREKLKSPQKVVNFLLQDYWIRNKLMPQINQVQNEIAAQNLNYKPKEHIKPTPKTFQDFMNEIPNLEFEPEHRKLWAEIQSSNLSDKQKQLLQMNMKKSNL